MTGNQRIFFKWETEKVMRVKGRKVKRDKKEKAIKKNGTRAFSNGRG